ncbi:MAG: RNA 2',3'-cyclic phosphodiesterase [Candidatus Helarchaeota archaeon]
MVLLRSFFAIEVIDENILSNIGKIQEEFRVTNAHVKYVEIKNIHITLKFLGDVEERVLQDIIEDVKKISIKPFEIEFKSVGSFPKPAFPKVIWIGIDKGKNEVMDLSKQIDSTVSRYGIKREKRFQAHLTIGRVRSGRNRNALITKLMEHQKHSEEVGTMQVNSFQLKKSQLTRAGPIYTTLYDFPLGKE